MGQRFLVLSASMGAGHDAVARELERRLRERGHTVAVRDVLALLPPGAGGALRGGYRAALRHAPWLYAAVYDAFLAPGGDGGGTGAGSDTEAGTDTETEAQDHAWTGGRGPGSGPLAALAEPQLLRIVRRLRPDAVVSTFHLSAQLNGRLRARGALRTPSAVAVTDFAVHRGWLHGGNDLYLCPTAPAARAARAGTGTEARVTGPVVPPSFLDAARGEGVEGAGAGAGAAWRAEFERLAPGGGPAVLLSTGAWGVGSGLARTARETARAGALPVLLCGGDERLRRTALRHGLTALGWVADMPGLMSACRALVDNAAGQTAAQALAAGLPVIGHRPLPGHGAAGVRAMAAAGLSELVLDPGELAAAVARLLRHGPARGERVAAGLSAFGAGPVPLLEALALEGAGGDVSWSGRGGGASRSAPWLSR